MRVVFKHGEKIKKPKPPSRKQQVEEMAQALIAKWTARDREAAMKKYGITYYPFDND